MSPNVRLLVSCFVDGQKIVSYKARQTTILGAFAVFCEFKHNSMANSDCHAVDSARVEPYNPVKGISGPVSCMLTTGPIVPKRFFV